MALLSFDAQRFLELLASHPETPVTEDDVVNGMLEDAWTPDLDQLVGNVARNAAWVGRNLDGPLTLPFVTWLTSSEEIALWMPGEIAESIQGTGWKRRSSPRTG
jgi:hypothetical protein